MKGLEWETLARREILPLLGDQYAVRRSLIYRRPVEHVLLGISAETKYEATRLSMEAVVMPLYRPNDGLRYFVENWLGAFDVENGQLPPGAVEMCFEAVPFLDAHATPEALLVDASWKRVDDFVRLEVEGYSYLLVGDQGAAREVLGHALTLETDPEREWEEEIQQRCRHVLMLMEEGAIAARRQLIKWEDQTLAALRLSRT